MEDIEAAYGEFIEGQQHASLDFGVFIEWYNTRLKEMRTRERQLVLKENAQKRERERRRARRGKIKPKPHKMTRRSHVNDILSNEQPEHIPAQMRSFIGGVHGLSKCCTCGSIKETKYFSVTSTRTAPYAGVSASCIRCSAMAGYDANPLKWFSNYITNEARQRAKNSKIPFNITSEWVMEKFNENHGKCVLCSREMTLFKKDSRGRERSEHSNFMVNPSNMSLDQRVPGAGYTMENVQLVNLHCNLAKMDLSQEAFLEMCRGVVRTHGRGSVPR